VTNNQPHPAFSALAHPGWIKTFTGRFVQPLALTVADIDIMDIAHSLSRVCRFGGHCSGVLNVAAHSVRVFHRYQMLNPNATKQDMLTALLHDASEAYLGDIPRPLKIHPEFRFYREAEQRAEAVIAAKFDLIYPMPQSVKQTDDDELLNELNFRRYEPFDESPSLSEAEFLYWFQRINEQ